MRLAEILSDLVSLRVCVRPFAIPIPPLRHIVTHPQDPAAALALVNTTSQDNTTHDEEDVDLKRAKDLLKYHYEVKEAHKRGELSRGLEDARRAVGRAVGG